MPLIRIWEMQWASLFCGEEAESGGTEPPDRHSGEQMEERRGCSCVCCARGHPVGKGPASRPPSSLTLLSPILS